MTAGHVCSRGAPISIFADLVLPFQRSLFALERTADYYVVAYTKIGPARSIACDF
jgi:hypothetical protein